MKTGITTRTTVCAVLAALLGTGVLAEEEGRGRGRGPRHRDGEGPCGGKMREHHEQMREKRQTFMEQQRGEDKTFREGIKDSDPSDAVVKMIGHRETQHDETVDFAEQQHEALVAFAKATMDECEVPAERQQEHLDRIDERYEGFTEKHSEMHQKVIDTLTGLSKQDDLTWEDIRQAMKSLPRPRRGGQGHRGRGERPDGEGSAERGKVGWGRQGSRLRGREAL